MGECQSLKKTTNLQYESLKPQEYWSYLYPSQSRLIFKWRSKTLDLKTHLTYKYSDSLCRLCKIDTETPEHAVNCGKADRMELNVDILNVNKTDDFTKSELKKLAIRMRSFLESVEDAGR